MKRKCHDIKFDLMIGRLMLPLNPLSYGRIIKRIKSELLPVQEAEAMSILKWVACSERPMRRQELQQARMIQVGARTIDSEREPFQDLVHLCGPIVEVRNGNISFVHFTAKE